MNARSLVLAVACLFSAAASAVGQTQAVTVQWDASSGNGVAGYIVYVGHASGSYDEQYDVGPHTSFVFTKANPGRPYYFAVSAYVPGPIVGPRSEEVLFLGGIASADLSRPRARGDDASAEAAEDLAPDRFDSAETAVVQPDNAGDASVLCVGGAECYRVETLAHIAGSVGALTRAPDERLLFIEDGQRVRIIEDGALVLEPALNAGTSAALTGLVLDPGFSDTRLVYVGVVEVTSGGDRQLDIVRYREVANALGEGAVIVAGLPLPATGDAALAIDSSRRLYVAMPTAPVSDARTTPYAGMVLRFESDGTTARDDGAAAPVFSRGYAQPTALAWTDEGNDLWLSGTGADGAGALTRFSLNRASAESAVVPESVALGAGSAVVSLTGPQLRSGGASSPDARVALLLVDESGGVVKVAPAPGMVMTPWIGPNELGGLVSAAAGSVSDGDVYLAVTGETDSAPLSSRIIRLRRHQAPHLP